MTDSKRQAKHGGQHPDGCVRPSRPRPSGAARRASGWTPRCAGQARDPRVGHAHRRNVVPAPPAPGQRRPNPLDPTRVTGFAAFTEREGRGLLETYRDLGAFDQDVDGEAAMVHRHIWLRALRRDWKRVLDR